MFIEKMIWYYMAAVYKNAQKHIQTGTFDNTKFVVELPVLNIMAFGMQIQFM